MEFEISETDSLGRIGEINVNGKHIITPTLFPVVHPVRNLIPPSDLERFGVQAIFTNSYIIYQNENLREKISYKGLHKFFNFNKLIATDSGAFQQYMYNENKIEISAAEIERFQERINSDFPVILDIPIQMNDSYEVAKEKVLKTIQRAKENINRRENEKCHWFGPIHGGKYSDLLKMSSEEMSKLDFSVYAIGGLVKPFLDYRFDVVIDILLNVKKNIIPNRPIHMFGLGLPQFFSLAVACGCDLMDSAAYILYAKEGRYFTLSGTKKLDELEVFPCSCPICERFTPEEVKMLPKEKCIKLLAKHNLYISFSELRAIRQAIKEGNLWELLLQRIHSHPELIKAMDKLFKNLEFLETFEKSYKKHGRLITSNEDLQRPIIYRYLKKIKNSYRSPQNTKYLFILPELDISGKNSPSICNWLHDINNFEKISREEIHIGFFSKSFGIIPLELVSTFPMGQHESVNSIRFTKLVFKETQKKLQEFFLNHRNRYEQCVIFIPDFYINKFHEKVQYNGKIFLQHINFLKNQFKDFFIIKNNLKTLLECISENKQK